MLKALFSMSCHKSINLASTSLNKATEAAAVSKYKLSFSIYLGRVWRFQLLSDAAYVERQCLPGQGSSI